MLSLKKISVQLHHYLQKRSKVDKSSTFIKVLHWKPIDKSSHLHDETFNRKKHLKT